MVAGIWLTWSYARSAALVEATGVAGDDLHAGHRAEDPDDAERRDGPERRGAVPVREPGEAEHGQRHEDEHDDGEERTPRPRQRSPCVGRSSR